jgi:hypothetical protein
MASRAQARIIFRRAKKHVATTMTGRLRGDIFSEVSKQAFSFNVLKRDTIMHKT